MAVTSAISNNNPSAPLYERLAEAIRTIREAEGLTQSSLASMLQINQATLSRFLQKGSTTPLPLNAITKLCEEFELNLPELVSADFTYRTLAERRQDEKDTGPQFPLSPKDLGDSLIVNPDAPAFNQYLRTYHCYFLPTRSGEDGLIFGRLTLEAKKGICHAKFDLYINAAPAENVPADKEYSGFAMVSTSCHTMYVILYSAKIGELSVLNFRHFNLNLQPLDCRIAEVLTNSAGESHVPTVHRMIMSSEPILPEHLDAIKPHLLLNSDTIIISKENLEQLPFPHEGLKEHLPRLVKADTYYTFREKYILSNAEQVLPPVQAQQLLADFRRYSICERTNKVSADADDNLHQYLTEQGYFRKNKVKN